MKKQIILSGEKCDKLPLKRNKKMGKNREKNRETKIDKKIGEKF